jgi:hypothetical protein
MASQWLCPISVFAFSSLSLVAGLHQGKHKLFFGHDHCHLLYAIVVARTLPASAWVEEKGGFQAFIRIAIEEKE